MKKEQIVAGLAAAGALTFLASIVFGAIPPAQQKTRTLADACKSDFGAKSCADKISIPVFKTSNLAPSR
jgi:hypothetical protein